jgi:putative hydrolase of the HAD superfamily
MIRAVLFDLDGTLVDFVGLKKAAISNAAKFMVRAGLEMTEEEVTEKLDKVFWEIGIESNTAIEEFLEKIGKLDDHILAAGINGYIIAKIEATKPVDGAVELINKLKAKGIKVAIVTDAPRLKAWKRLCVMGMDMLFDAVVAFEDTGCKKPDKMPFEAALRKLGVKPEETLMVGDWYKGDIEGAKRLGIKTVLVGEPKGEEDYCVTNVGDILKDYILIYYSK